MNSVRPSRNKTIAILAAFGAWFVVVGLWMASALPDVIRLGSVGLEGRYILAAPIYDIAFGIAALGGLLVVREGRRMSGLARYVRYSIAFLPLWHASVYFADRLDFPAVRVKLADLGIASLFILGLGWLVWFVERRWNEHIRYAHGHGLDSTKRRDRVWDPLHPAAWYYGKHNAKLHQSLAILANYSLLFFLACLLSTQLSGCQEVFDMPAGGGKQVARAQQVKIQKVIKKKYVINPYSSIIMSVRKIDDVKINVAKMTANQYTIGQGDGDGAGFGGANVNAKVRFIRLEYSGGDWDQDMGIGADLNLLIQYSAQIQGSKVAEQTESRTVSQLGNFKAGAAPPLMYMTGQKGISLSKSEVKILREYLVDNHGMLFIDNGGSSTFHSQAFAMMRMVVPEIEPVKVPLDDVIHSIPNPLPFLPYVAPHGGRDAWGWKLDGRWICYYHPGDIGDAWSDGHSGVKQDVWEACYELGINVIQYAYSEQAKWLAARRGP